MITICPESLVILVGTLKRNTQPEQRREIYNDILRIFSKNDLQIAKGMDKVLDLIIYGKEKNPSAGGKNPR